MPTREQIQAERYGNPGVDVSQNDVCELDGVVPPTDGTTGAGIAGPGSTYTDITGKAKYVNTGTKAAPVWTRTTTSTLTLTDGATVAWDMSLGGIATLTLGGNRTMAAPTNLKPGSYILHVLQDGVGSRTITWNAIFKWPGAVAPTLTATASRHDIFSFVCDGTNLYGSMLPDVR